MSKKGGQKGISLIEVLISVLLVSVVMSTALVLHFMSLRLAVFSGQKTQAYFLVKQVMNTANYENSAKKLKDFVTSADLSQPYYLEEKTDPNEQWIFRNTDQNRYRITINGDNFYRFIKFEKKAPSDVESDASFDPAIRNNYYKVTVRVCYSESAANQIRCELADKNYLEDATYMVMQ